MWSNKPVEKPFHCD